MTDQARAAYEALQAIMRMAGDAKEPCSMDPESPVAIRNGKFASIAQVAAQGLGLVRGPSLAAHPTEPDHIVDANKMVVAAPAQPAAGPLSQAARDVLAERQRQISAEGWTLAHDDNEHNDGQALARAAGCYLLFSDAYPNAGQPPAQWPWDAGWWKPKDYRRDVVRAAALALAEIERLDRTLAQKNNLPLRDGGES